MGASIQIDDIAADKPAIHNQSEYSKSQLLAQLVPKRGHKMYEVDIDNKSVSVVTSTKDLVLSSSSLPSVSKQTFETKDNCLYISCLNKRNLIRLIINAGGQDISDYTFNT